MRTICIINQKGGVGKTTTAVNVASGLSRQGKRVLLVDMDPQGNIADSLTSSRTMNVYDFLQDRCSSVDCITPLGKNLDLMHSTLELAEFNREEKSHQIVANAFKKIGGYDYIIFDCAPSVSLLNENVMFFATECMIPIRATHLSKAGLASMLEFIDTINQRHSHELAVRYIVPTHYDVRVRNQRELMKEFERSYPELLTTPIRINARLAEAPAKGKSIFAYAKASRGAQDYASLVAHIVGHEEEPAEAAEPISSRIQKLMADVKAED